MSQQRNDGDEEGDKKQVCYLTAAFFAFWFVLLVNRLWPDTIPYKTFELWSTRGTWQDWLLASWPIFAWAAGVSLVISAVTENDPNHNREAEAHYGAGFLISLWAGVMEEISFRWLLFMSAIVTMKISNYLFFGWAGLGLVEWFHLHVEGPIVNWTTLGYLREQVANPANWAIGAALVATNAFFHDGHKYQGWFGYTNSWFIGMYFFWLLFSYGLLAAILAHFVYNFIVFTVRYLDMVVERKLGHA